MKGTVAIITGASQGIGRATALRLAKDFSSIVLAARNGNALKEVAQAVGQAGAEALAMALDLREPAADKALVDETLKRFGRIDALINIAGAVPQIELLEMTDAQWDDGMALKLHGARRITIHAWNALKESSGSVVFTSGNSAEAPKSAYGAVATINAAVIAMARAFAERGIKDGVQVNSVLPGPVLTNRRKTYMEKYAPAHNMTFDEAMDAFPAQTGISRYGQPEEIADLMAFLVSPQAKWMTGSAVRMDGGEIKGV
ncbi:MAG TPA: SDR family oxidoreductase [Verrucomicrobiae bacterium]|jgi:3-oxoacyl-[acyl-carrier protein] reductase|nr:SDR family oxidoreductase [Verrucomicrobiae bacterium]